MSMMASKEVIQKSTDASGPGTELHAIILRRFKQSETFDCGCRSYIASMNTWGVEGCLRRIDRITRKLLVEAHRRGLLDSKVPGMKWVKRRGAKRVCRWMVGKAIRRAAKVQC
jgi:hypothetical protein